MDQQGGCQACGESAPSKLQSGANTGWSGGDYEVNQADRLASGGDVADRTACVGENRAVQLRFRDDVLRFYVTISETQGRCSSGRDH